MDVITNKEVNVYLDNEKGTLCLTGMLVGTMVFLYDSQGVHGGIFVTENSVQYSGGSGFCRFGMRSIGKISYCLRKA